MTTPDINQVQENKVSDKELNFRALEAKFQRQLEQERAARIEAERVAQEALNRKPQVPEDDDDDEPYIDKKRLKKEQAKFGQQIKQETQNEIQRSVQMALNEERKQNWLKQNPDFYDTLSQHAQKFADREPELAESILQIPDEFERSKLAYKNIKALGINKPEVKQPSIQEVVNNNRKSPYYQPSGIGSTPYAQVGDFSASGQKNAYDKMKQLQAQLRI
jgi:hypothetical protein